MAAGAEIIGCHSLKLKICQENLGNELLINTLKNHTGLLLHLSDTYRVRDKWISTFCPPNRAQLIELKNLFDLFPNHRNCLHNWVDLITSCENVNKSKSLQIRNSISIKKWECAIGIILLMTKLKTKRHFEAAFSFRFRDWNIKIHKCDHETQNGSERYV